MTTFNASNGVTVLEKGGGRLGVSSGWDMHPADVVALREFFQHEHDDALGRWRFPAHPDFVVYPSGDSRNRVTVFSEHCPTAAVTFWRRTPRPNVTSGLYMDAAVAYFDSHPEPKAWHDAKPGEVWELTVSEWGTRTDPFYVGMRGEGLQPAPHPVFEAIAPNYPVTYLGIKAPVITAGRRIWPEGDA